MRVAVTGHQAIESDVEQWVRDAVAQVLTTLPRPITGVTSLAAGADQIFAEAVLALSGGIEVVVPFRGYEHEFADPRSRELYDMFLARAARVRVLEAADSKEASYFAAGKDVVRTSDLLVAVWDGKPSRGLGGTADVVRFAQAVGRPIMHINPVTRRIMALRGVPDTEEK